jgi:hypothetical protein
MVSVVDVVVVSPQEYIATFYEELAQRQGVPQVLLDRARYVDPLDVDQGL